MARAFSAVNIQFMHALELLRRCSQAATSETKKGSAVDAAIETLAAQHADLDLHHVEPACVPWGVVELDAAQNAPGLRGGKGLVDRACRVCRQVVEHEADFLGVWEVDVDEIAHAACEVLRRPSVGDLGPAPGSVGVEEDKEIGRAVTPIFAVETLQLSRRCGNGQARLADELGRAFVEADDRVLWVWLLVVEIELQ